ncbi:MAG: signal peptidase I [Acidimicrobiia bacterium]|nr:signal peptidase I [Acidimicrobiia bacterium]
MLFRRFAIAEASMSPHLQEGDYVVTWRRRPARGDVIVFEHPDRTGFHLIKRVIGMAGQTIDVEDGAVFVDGRELVERWTVDDTTPNGSWRVPAGHVFVLGDARHRSRDDGRTLGPILIGDQANVAFFRYWPLRRAGLIDRPR